LRVFIYPSVILSLLSIIIQVLSRSRSAISLPLSPRLLLRPYCSVARTLKILLVNADIAFHPHAFLLTLSSRPLNLFSLNAFAITLDKKKATYRTGTMKEYIKFDVLHAKVNLRFREVRMEGHLCCCFVVAPPTS
jgi:hypothetical protein